jgi:predicted nucleic acid-binding protein
VDTNILIYLAKLNLLLLPSDMAISAITLAELSAGPAATTDPVERARRTSVLQHAEASFDPLPFDAPAPRVFGQVSAAVRAAGRTPRRRAADLMIASVAISNGLPLYTINPGGYVGLDELLKVVAVPRP